MKDIREIKRRVMTALKKSTPDGDLILSMYILLEDATLRLEAKNIIARHLSK